MFRNTKEPSTGGEHLCLAKITCVSMVQVHVNSVSIMAAYISGFVCVYGSLYRRRLQLYQIHLKCANFCNSIWQHIESSIEVTLIRKMDILYRSLLLHSDPYTHTTAYICRHNTDRIHMDLYH